MPYVWFFGIPCTMGFVLKGYELEPWECFLGSFPLDILRGTSPLLVLFVRGMSVLFLPPRPEDCVSMPAVTRKWLLFPENHYYK